MHHSLKIPATFQEVTEEATAETEAEVVRVLTAGHHQDLTVQKLFVRVLLNYGPFLEIIAKHRVDLQEMIIKRLHLRKILFLDCIVCR